MGRYIISKSIDYGRNPDVFAPSDRCYVRCSRCGWINNTAREAQSEEGSRIGYGINYVPVMKALAFSSTIGFSTTVAFNGPVESGVVDPQVVSGCAQCGTMLYNK